MAVGPSVLAVLLLLFWATSLRAAAAVPVRLTDDPAVDYHPSWSPDGTRIVFMSLRSGAGDLFVMPAEGGEIMPLVEDPGSDDEPAWSPDGLTVAFAGSRGGAPDIYLASLAGGVAVRFTDHATVDGGPAWSPDGQRIAYHAGTDGNLDIWVLDFNPPLAGEATTWGGLKGVLR